MLSSSRTEVLAQMDGIQTDRGAACAALAGYVTLTARNGDSMMHGVLPSVIPHQSAALNGCFPGSDGNWCVKLWFDQEDKHPKHSEQFSCLLSLCEYLSLAPKWWKYSHLLCSPCLDAWLIKFSGSLWAHLRVVGMLQFVFLT